MSQITRSRWARARASCAFCVNLSYLMVFYYNIRQKTRS
jgi:hypothetical protein